jgi:hypothetical protein
MAEDQAVTLNNLDFDSLKFTYFHQYSFLIIHGSLRLRKYLKRHYNCECRSVKQLFQQ